MPNQQVTIHTTKPQNFSPWCEVAACHCEWDNQYLVLKRANNSSEANTWCIPAGKLEPGETAEDGVLREVFEEIGIVLHPENVAYMGKFFIRKLHMDYVYHMFHCLFQKAPVIKLAKEEHQAYLWLKPEELIHKPLISGGKEIFQYFQYLKFTYSERKLVVKRAFSEDQYQTCLDIRKQVFIREQGVPVSIEIDEWEADSLHFSLSLQNKLIGTARMRFGGEYLKFERIAILKAFRGKGMGKTLMKGMVAYAQNFHSQCILVMHAQAQVLSFYEKLGWKRQGSVFLEADIEHYRMVFPKQQ